MEPTPPLSAPGRFRRLLFLILIVVTGGGMYWGVGTEDGARIIVPWLADLPLRPQHIDIRFGGIRGTLLEGLEVASLTGNLPLKRLSFTVASLSIRVSPHLLLVGRPTVREVVCRMARISGPPPAGWIERLPPLPPLSPFGCFLIPGAKVEIGRIRIDRLEWVPSPQGPSLVLTGFELGEPVQNVVAPSDRGSRSKGDAAKLEQPLRCSGLGTWHDREVFRGELIGTCSNQVGQVLLEGLCDGRVLGIPLKNELRARFGREGVKLDGFLQPATVVVASVSRLFEPLWTPHWPLMRATGTASLSGSWLLDPRLGFQGNLRGGFQQVGAFLLGFNLTLFELTAEVAIRQDEVIVRDRGSHFLGMPASLEGIFSWSPDLPPGGNLILEVPDFRPGEFIASFPWLVRKSIGWPEMEGSASLKLQVVGRPASILGNLATDRLQIRKGGTIASLTGRVSLRQDAVKGPEWRIHLGWECPDGVPGVIRKLARAPFPWADSFTPPCSLDVSLMGHTPASWEMEGFLGANGKSYPIEGRLIDGRLEYLKTENGTAPVSIAFPNDHLPENEVLLSDLALFSGL